MADVERESALAGHLHPGRSGCANGAAGVRLEERAVSAMAQLSGLGEAVAIAVHGLDAPPPALRCGHGDGVDLLWTGPGQYLAVSGNHYDDELARSLATALAATGGVAVDLSHARSVLRLDGPACREVLAKGCALDVDAMAPDDCAPTLLSHFNVLLHCVAAETFDVYVTRSFALACFEWLRRAGEEFGIEVR